MEPALTHDGPVDHMHASHARRAPLEEPCAYASWHAGRYHPALHAHSPNCDARPANILIDLIVLHSISLPPGEYGSGAIHALFTNQLDCSAHPAYHALRGLHVSSHFVISRSGRLWQYVDGNQRAWHAGLSYYRGRMACNDDSIGIELEGLEGRTFTAAQYRALLPLCAALMQRWPIRYIAGHQHIAPGRKGDPGAGFDWQRLYRAFAGSGLVFPPGFNTRAPLPALCELPAHPALVVMPPTPQAPAQQAL